MKSHVLFLAAALAVSAVQASAAVVDTDANGTYSLEEMTAAYADLTEETFAEIDSDQSGEISEDELTAAVESGLLAE